MMIYVVRGLLEAAILSLGDLGGHCCCAVAILAV